MIHATWLARVVPLTTAASNHVTLAIGLTQIAAAYAVVHHAPTTPHLLHATHAVITQISSFRHAPTHMTAAPPWIHHGVGSGDLLNRLAAWYPSATKPENE